MRTQEVISERISLPHLRFGIPQGSPDTDGIEFGFSAGLAHA
jgi:hypothetical protein